MWIPARKLLRPDQRVPLPLRVSSPPESSPKESINVLKDLPQVSGWLETQEGPARVWLRNLARAGVSWPQGREYDDDLRSGAEPWTRGRSQSGGPASRIGESRHTMRRGDGCNERKGTPWAVHKSSWRCRSPRLPLPAASSSGSAAAGAPNHRSSAWRASTTPRSTSTRSLPPYTRWSMPSM